MITVETTTDIDRVNRLVFHKDLQPYITYAGLDSKYKVLPQGMVTLVFMKGEEEVGSLTLTPMTSVTYHGHIGILPKHWGSSIPQECIAAGVAFLKPYAKPLIKVLAYVPESQLQVKNFMFRIGCKLDGSISKAIEQKGKLDNLLLFTFDIKGQ